ncbi:porin [Jeongeupia naejangsanensis]|uniref:Porin n=1 Tax=Jeongeupia naejangsanensis TaxID=613195 RepID=A0ABS2BHR3_9NEIS|nr:porin [Jeongeupia naejangsanensis]MBM3115162.1 porin [Jeongeupia naejangsanensis]
MFKRALVAASLAAAFAAPAFAEVTIGGSIESDIYIHGSNADGIRDEVELDVEPRLFFSGSDKLDNGSKVIWKIWTGVENYRAQNDKTWGNREAWGGWQGDWGTLRFGRIYTPSYLKLDWPYGNLGGAMHVAELGLVAYNPDNSIAYDSPNWGGFSFSGYYSFLGQQNQVDGVDQEYMFDVTAGYSGGGFMIDAGYQEAAANSLVKQNGADVLVHQEDPSKFWFVAGGYNFGAFTLKGGYKGWENSWGGQTGDQNQYFVQGIYSAGKHTVGVTYNYFDDVDGVKLADGSKGKLEDSSSQVVYGQWNYALSNNTSAYVQGRYAWNDKNGVIGADYANNGHADSSSYRLLFGTWTGF